MNALYRMHVGCLLLLAAVMFASDQPVSLETLLPEMSHLAGLAEYPAPAYTCLQASSYDRASKTPADTAGWFANDDRGQYLRSERVAGRTEHVMMEAAGPGAIVRLWSADPRGTLRFYLDGATEATWTVPFADLLGGKVAGVPEPIAGIRAKGWNCYLPIPFVNGCKLTVDLGGMYYHVNWRSYAAGTAVASFAPGQLTEHAEAVRATSARLASPDLSRPPPADSTTAEFSVSIARGASARIARLTGPRAVRLLRLDWKPSADREEPALRSTTIGMTCDGERTMQVPLGDFFGSGPGINPFAALTASVAKDGTMQSRWIMPFAKEAEIVLTNHGAAPVTLAGAVVSTPYPWGPRSMHFHADWRIGCDLKTSPRQDWNFATLRGQGVLVGTALAIDNPKLGWWGEGDEKIYLDGAAFPTWFGTGAEDYYGYAWCDTALFSHAYHAQPRADGDGCGGRISVNRFHILDRIPFERDLRFDMELWHHQECQVNLAATTWWYARPGASSNTPAPTTAELTLRAAPVVRWPRVNGAIEGEELRMISPRGGAEPQQINNLSGGWQLWWHGGQKTGDRLELGFDAPTAGTYTVFGRFVHSRDYAIITTAINDGPAGAPIDLYNDGVRFGTELPLGTAVLAAGANRLIFTVAGSNPKAQAPGNMVGLDYIRLQAGTP